MSEGRRNFEGNSINTLMMKSAKSLLSEGTPNFSRNGTVLEFMDSSFYLTSPRHRHLYLLGRNNNIFATIAEVFWVLAGKDELNPLMSFVLPRCVDFSDDKGVTWRGAYGPRIWSMDQIDHVLNMFRIDGINTRRACMSIWQPDKDTLKAVRKQGLKDSLDYPCNSFIWYWIRDNKFYCKVQSRSADLIWGILNINLVEWTVLQEIMMQLVNNNLDEELDLGYYHHAAISLHMYDFSSEQAMKLCSISGNNEYLKPREVFRTSIGGIKEPKELLKFFNDIYSYLCSLAEGSLLKDKDHLKTIFQVYKIPTENNQLYYYALMVDRYLKIKHGQKEYIEIMVGELLTYPEDLRLAITLSVFNPLKKLCGV